MWDGGDQPGPIMTHRCRLHRPQYRKDPNRKILGIDVPHSLLGSAATGRGSIILYRYLNNDRMLDYSPMQVHPKPQLDYGALYAFLAKHWPQPITGLGSLVEGEDSQALYFDSGNHRYVLRINRSNYGFRKDAYAWAH